MPLNNKRDPNPAQNQPGRQLSSTLGSIIPLLLLLLCRISLFGLFCVLLPAWLHKKWNLLVPVGIVALAEQIIIMDASSSSPLHCYTSGSHYSPHPPWQQRSPALNTRVPNRIYLLLIQFGLFSFVALPFLHRRPRAHLSLWAIPSYLLIRPEERYGRQRKGNTSIVRTERAK